MLNWQNIIKILLLISILFVSYPTLACKPLIYPISYYVQEQVSGQVIFLGKVVSVEEKKDKDGVVYQTIEFTPTRWFGGEKKGIFKVSGVIGTMHGTDCEGVFDFSAKVGEEWLIFGQLHDNIVTPDRFNSIKVIDGKIPPFILKEIKKLESKK